MRLPLPVDSHRLKSSCARCTCRGALRVLASLWVCLIIPSRRRVVRYPYHRHITRPAAYHRHLLFCAFERPRRRCVQSPFPTWESRRGCVSVEAMHKAFTSRTTREGGECPSRHSRVISPAYHHRCYCHFFEATTDGGCVLSPPHLGSKRTAAVDATKSLHLLPGDAPTHDSRAVPCSRSSR